MDSSNNTSSSTVTLVETRIETSTTSTTSTASWQQTMSSSFLTQTQASISARVATITTVVTVLQDRLVALLTFSLTQEDIAYYQAEAQDAIEAQDWYNFAMIISRLELAGVDTTALNTQFLEQAV